MATKAEIEEYYFKTWKDLDDRGLTKPNARHYAILDKARKNGLNRNSKVLEVGCGIGTLSNLIAGYIKKGKLTAVDISPETIALAKFKFKKRSNIEFMISDMANWEHSSKFDIIILPDVIEHIPFDQHRNLFERLKRVAHENTRILINIPHPKAIEYCIKERPDLLQIIDLPVQIDFLSQNVYSIGYYINNIEPYSIGFNAEDYQFIVLKPQKVQLNWGERPKLSRFIQFWILKVKSWI